MELLEVASRAGVSRWVHPVLFNNLEPLLLVEGKFDHSLLVRALTLLGKERLLRISYLEQMGDSESTGGVDELKGYIKHNAWAIKSRSRKAPVLVLLDWESAGKKAQFERWFTRDDPFGVLAWDVEGSNPRLTKRFRGIEKFLPDRVIERAIGEGGEILVRRDRRTWTVEPDNYEAVKQKLNTVIERELAVEDLEYIRPLVDRVEMKLRELREQQVEGGRQ
jgi:hypothetical protein